MKKDRIPDDLPELPVRPEPTAEELLKEILDKTMTGDTEELAKALLFRFDSFAGVISAPIKELMKVKGMEHSAAKFITDIPRFFRRYIDDMNSPNLRVYSTEIAYKLVRNKFFGRKTEIIVLVILNSKGQVVYNNIIAEGSVSMVPVYIKQIMQLCVEYNADTIILAHNHPSGNPSPSKGDVVATKEVQMAVESIYVTMHDHMIFTDTDYFSMRGSGWLESIVRGTEQVRQNALAEAMADERAWLETQKNRGEE